MKSIKLKSIILLSLSILYIFLIPDKYSIMTVLMHFYDLPSLLVALIVPIILILIKTGKNSLKENISIPISILYAICWAFTLPLDKVYLVLLPIIYGFVVSILISLSISKMNISLLKTKRI